MTANTPTFNDLQNHWAKPFIEALSREGIITGFPDRTFRPNQPLTRVQLAALLSRAFSLPPKRPAITFKDIPRNFWGASVIEKAYTMGFLSGFPNQIFKPNDEVIKVQVILSLVNGLTLQNPHSSLISLPTLYQDAAEIPQYAITQVQIATAAGMVVNYPNLKSLQPNKATTRGEVSALIYQALVQTGRMTPITNPYLVPPPFKTVKVSHQRELRGVWIVSVWNHNFPTQQNLTAEQQQQELVQILDLVQSLNFNAIFLQIRPEGDALYFSRLEPWSHWLTGVQGKAPEPLYDPFQFVITEARARNLEVHAWFNPYRSRSANQTYTAVAPHVDITNPEAVYDYGKERWMDPGLKVIQDRTYQVILDVVNRYDLDGVHLDDYFYPYPIAGQEFPDRATYEAYQKAGGTLSLGDWRRDNVNKMVERLAKGIRAAKPHVKFGVSPFGIYRPDQPPGMRGLDQYEALYSDPKKWLQEGWLDYIAPQLYWRIDQTAQSYPVLLKWWAENNPKGAHIYVGNNLTRLSSSTWSVEEYEKQVQITRELSPQLTLGNIFYNLDPLMTNLRSVNELFKTKLYQQPALVPVMSQKMGTPPPFPLQVKGQNGQLTWQPGSDRDVRAWTIYQETPNGWQLHTILPGSARGTRLEAGTYALACVNRFAQESEGLVVTL